MMYARSTTVTAQPSKIDDGIAYLRDEGMPLLMDCDGCVGLSVLVDRDSGRCIATTAWESQDAMHASEPRVVGIRNDASSRLGGTIDKVEEWEIAVLHREHELGASACARCSWFDGPASAIDQAIDVFRNDVLPRAEEQQGFCSASMFVDRDSGRCVWATAWENRTAMDATRDIAQQVRASAKDKMNAQVIDVMEFDLPLAHLRVPEMA